MVTGTTTLVDALETKVGTVVVVGWPAVFVVVTGVGTMRPVVVGCTIAVAAVVIVVARIYEHEHNHVLNTTYMVKIALQLYLAQE